MSSSELIGAWRIVSPCHVIFIALPRCKVAFCVICYNCYSSSLTVLILLDPFSQIENLRTVIVTADIHHGLYKSAHVLRQSPPVFNLLALVRCHPLYILLRVRRELCFW